jgi:phosphoribosyl 1,2-cyclic phosphate phosphodiesterase
MRSSVSIEYGGKHFLVDCSIDFRQQMLNWPMPRIDAVLVTHTHSDHINGIDDLRAFNYYQRETIPVYSSRMFLDDIKTRFNYCFRPFQKGGGVPSIDLCEVQAGSSFEAAGVEIMPIGIEHGKLSILGFRMGGFAYLTDCSGIPEESRALLEGVEVIIISGLRHTPHPTHFTINQSLEVAGEIGVREAWFTHIADELDHETTNSTLPEWAQLAHDGLLLEV